MKICKLKNSENFNFRQDMTIFPDFQYSRGLLIFNNISKCLSTNILLNHTLLWAYVLLGGLFMMENHDNNHYYSQMYRYQLPYFPNIPANLPYHLGSHFMNQNTPYHMPFGGNNMVAPPLPNYYQNQYSNPYPNQKFMHYSNPYSNQMFNQYPSFNQYPMGQQSPIMSHFKSQDGKFDFNKIMSASGQMVGVVNQISSLVKGISSTFKGI